MLYSLVFLTLWYSRLCLDFLSRMPAQGSQHLSLSHWSLLFFIPSFSTSLWQEHSPPCTYFFLANLHVLVPPMLNPVIYGAKTKQMRGSMTHMVSAVEVLREGTALNAFSVSLTNMRERACWWDPTFRYCIICNRKKMGLRKSVCGFKSWVYYELIVIHGEFILLKFNLNL